MTDDLAQLSDAALNELVAVEVAGWRCLAGHDWVPNGKPFEPKHTEELPLFPHDFNAVMPLLEHSPFDVQISYSNTCSCWSVTLLGRFTSGATFTGSSEEGPAKAACLALLRSVRARKAQA